MLKNARAIPRLPDYLSMIREHGMIPGLSAHMPELVVFSDLNGYDVETYIQIYNSAGFLMQVEIEYVHSIIWGARKPVMTIKPMAAGRLSPFVGLTFAFTTIRDVRHGDRRVPHAAGSAGGHRDRHGGHSSAVRHTWRGGEASTSRRSWPSTPRYVDWRCNSGARPGAEQDHLLDDGGEQELRPENGPQGHLPLLFLRRKDRRARV